MKSVKGPIWNQVPRSAPLVGHQVSHRVSRPVWNKMYMSILSELNSILAPIRYELSDDKP